MNALKRAALATTMLACTSGAALATELNFASGWPPGATVTPVIEHFATSLEEGTGGALTMKVYSLSLLNFAEANEGVKNGVADFASMLTPYFAAEYARLNMLSEATSIMALEEYESKMPAVAFAGMITELVLLDCPSCQDELKRQNQISLGIGVSTPYLMACMVEIPSAEGLKGKRLRAGGALWSRWVAAMEAVPVSLSIHEAFEGLEQGVLDCSLGNAPDLDNFSLNEVVKHVYVGAPSGMFPFSNNMNLDRWMELDDAQRKVVLEAGADLLAGLAWDYQTTGDQALAGVVARGNDLAEVPDDLRAKSQAFLRSDIDALAGRYKELFGLEEGAELIQKLEALAPRWIALVEGVESSDQLAEILKGEIYSKVDIATFGR